MAALGWNFLSLGLDPPQGGGTDVGWLVSGVLFWLMAAGFVVPALVRAVMAAPPPMAGAPPDAPPLSPS